MKKQDLITKIAEELETTKVLAEKMLDTVFDTLSDVMKKGDSIAIPGFGSFTSAKRKAKTARNPKTGEKIEVPEKQVPKFKAAKKLKEHVDGKKK